MGQTIRELIREYDLYPYSKENFELVKESSEIELTRMYISGQRYLLENAEQVSDSSELLTEGFLFESSDEDELVMLEGKLAERISGWALKIKVKIKAMIHAIANFFRKIGAKLNGVNERAKATWSRLKSIGTLKDEDAKELAAKMEAIIGETKITFADSQDFTAGRVLLGPTSDKRLGQRLEAALGVKSEIKVGPSGDWLKALGTAQAGKFYDRMAQISMANHGSAKSVLDELNKYISQNSNGIVISKDSAKLTALTSTLDAAEKSISDQKDTTDRVKADEQGESAPNPKYDNGPDDTSGYPELLAAAQVSTGQTIRLYGLVTDFRIKVLYAIDDFLAKRGGTTKKDDDDKGKKTA